MQISSESKNLSELLPITGNAGYVIPEYQRNYSWKEEQIEQLFNDIAEEDPGYYVGNLLVTNHRDSNDDCDVIDGQQRLTTMSLFLLGIWECLNDWNSTLSEGSSLDENDSEIIFGLKRDIKRQLINEKTKKPRICLLEPDKEIYDAMLGIVNGKTKGRWGNRSLPKRYHFIYNLFTDRTRFDTPQAINDYYQKLVSATTLKISVPDLSEAFTVFSSLNSKGLPLTLVDLLKGEFLAAAKKNSDKNSAVECWSTFSSIFSENEGSDPNATLAMQFFVNNFDALESGGKQSITKSKALKKYQKLISEHYRSGEDYLQVLTDRAHVFAYIARIGNNVYPDGNVDDRLQKLNKLESSQAYPLLLFLFCNAKKLDIVGQLSYILDALIKFYVRRNITLVPKSSNIRAKMLDFIRTIDERGLTGEEVSSYIFSGLKDMSESDDHFADTILKDGMYDKNAKTTRFLLIDLERNLPGNSFFNKSNPDTLDEYVKKSQPRWTIEHILPEGPLPDYWKDVISPNDREQAEAVQRQYVHLIGNLTLSPYNANLKQLPFVNEDQPFQGEDNYCRSKRDFRDNGDFVGLREGLRLNSSIPSEGEKIEDKTTWTTDDIVRRTEWFKDLILDRYGFTEDTQN